MTERTKDTLLRFGKGLAKGLQWLSALAAGIALIAVPVILLLGKDLSSGPGDAGSGSVVGSHPYPVAAILLLMAAGLALMFLFFGRLRSIVASAQTGDPFIPENAARLEAMAWLLLGWEILNVLIGLARLYLANLTSGTENSLNWSLYDLDGLFIVLVLFILARIFRHGAAMREDLEGTV